jgi:hypothetical protein
MLNDLRYALRLLLKDRSFTITAVLALIVCIAANTAMFSIVRSVLMKPLPFPESEGIVLSPMGPRVARHRRFPSLLRRSGG